MSRVIVKNLPNIVNAKKLTDLFGAFGVVTDVQLKYAADGKFRGFGFIGFQSEDQANAAKAALNKSFINTSQIAVELCEGLGNGKKPKGWKKHEAAEKEPPKVEKKVKEAKKGKIKDAQVAEMLETHKGDVLFEEFMEAHLPDKKEIWQAEKTEEEVKKEADKLISDLEYLKLKKKNDPEEVKPKTETDTDRLTAKLSNLPCTVKKSDVKDFIKPAKAVSLRIPVKTKGIAYCDFSSLSELKKALTKNRSFLGTRRIAVKSLNKEKLSEKLTKTARIQRETDRMKQAETVADSGRLFVRNLAYDVLESDLRPMFEKFGPITELNVPIDPISRKPKGFGFITFLIPEHACKALNELDGTVLRGRMLHIIPGIAKNEEDDDETGLSFRQKKLKRQKQMVNNTVNWNTFFINENCLAEAMADVYNTSKTNVLTDDKANGGAAVRLALGETELIQKTKTFLEDNGVSLEAFENLADADRSETTILIKNLPYKTELSEIRDKFAPFGELKTVLLSPYGGTGIVEFIEPSEARKAFRSLAYTKFKHIPLYLEWAPKSVFNKPKIEPKPVEEPTPHIPVEGATLYVKGINFKTDSAGLKKHFEECGPIISAIVAEKRDPKNPTQKLSMGYGFVEFADIESADKALKTLQFSSLDNHTIDIKRSNRTTNETETARKRPKSKNKPSSKILVRNLPFQATQREVTDLFKVFGEIKAVRLPKKMVGTGTHRGFCFVEFISIHDAKRAFEALSESTHLYGRRLVLEWAEAEDDVETLREKTARHFVATGTKRKRIKIDEVPVENDDE